MIKIEEDDILLERLRQDLKQLSENFLQYLNIQERYSAIGNYQSKTPINKIADLLIEYAYESRVSDIHLEPQQNFWKIRYRIDGKLILVDKLDFKIGQYLLSYIKVISNLDIAERRLPQDGKYMYRTEILNIDLRVSTIPILYGEKLVLRLLGNIDNLLKIENMNFSHDNLQKMKDLLGASSGLVIITGPVNSGKSTLLYACLDKLNNESLNIITIEDPIELNMPEVNQMQVNIKAGLDFSVALKASLRQDPDVVMIGEIRDEVVAKQAIRAALTGHLVLSTVHASTVWEIPARLIDLGVSPVLLSVALWGMIAQRLVRRLCPHCKRQYSAQNNTIDSLVLGKSFVEGMTLYKSEGCASCNGTGFLGRVALQEVLISDHQIKSSINEINTKKVFSKLLEHKDFISLLEDGKTKILQGLTTSDEVLRALSGVYDFE